MKTEEFNRLLQRNRITVFTLGDAARLINKPKHYTTIFLKRDKIIKRAANGVYYTPDADNYEIASNMVYPAYVSLISALRFYNLTDQIPNTVYIVSSRYHKSAYIGEVKVAFSKVKPSLMYGYSKIDGAFVADAEKAVIDMFYLGKFVEYAEEAIESAKLDSRKLEYYAKL
ncbi:MAG: hypothetical protein QXL94_04750, partial [Candidatus Parvarchaeum sp.]